jgi:hypothetical protein
MVSIAMTALFIALPVALFLISRSVTRTAISIGVIFALAGGLLQASVSLGMDWTLSGLQWLVLGCLVLALAVGWWSTRRFGAGTAPRAHQVWAIWAPALVIGLVFLTMRLLASPDPGPLAGIGYLVSHGAAEDNAKWMNLASHLASGDALSFAGGYAGGPYLLVMAVAATAVSALSQLLLGGLNEVAVVTGTVIGSSFLLAALVPFAFAPLAEKQWRTSNDEPRRSAPGPLLWAGMLVLVTASINVSAIGHQSLQLVMLMLALWATTFLTGNVIPHARLMATVIAVAAGVVWFPINLWALAILAVTVTWVIYQFVHALRSGGSFPWFAAGLIVLAGVSFWDGLVSSTLYALGLDGGTPVSALGGATGSALARLASVPADTATLFSSPGGTEETTAYLTLAAIAAAIAAGAWLSKRKMTRFQVGLAFAPLGSLVAYTWMIATGDALLTGLGTNYATLKMTFLVTVVVFAATVPMALMSLDSTARGMSAMRWIGVSGVVFLLLADSLLPRATAAVSPLRWAAPNPDNRPFWTTFEVKQTADQPISSLPIACVFLPPGAEKPTGNIDGQLAYSCTRMLIGLNGAEGKVGSLMDWIRSDWLSNSTLWDEWYENLTGTSDAIKGKPIVLLDSRKQVIGFDTLSGLLNRFPPSDK